MDKVLCIVLLECHCFVRKMEVARGYDTNLIRWKEKHIYYIENHVFRLHYRLEIYIKDVITTMMKFINFSILMWYNEPRLFT